MECMIRSFNPIIAQLNPEFESLNSASSISTIVDNDKDDSLDVGSCMMLLSKNFHDLVCSINVLSALPDLPRKERECLFDVVQQLVFCRELLKPYVHQ